VIIVGDNKQLNPVLKLNEKEDIKNFQQVGLKDDFSTYGFSINSTFDLMQNIVPQTRVCPLNEHYRCEPDIIQFSNKKFYANNLIIKTTNLSTKFSGMKGILVNGRVHYGTSGSKSASNDDEVNAIIETLEGNFDHLQDKTIGVITPFRRQKELILEQIRKLAEREEKGERKRYYNSIEVGTVHTFQGDERDIIFFSAVISKGIGEGSVKWINNNPNLINVAVTRAIECFTMIGDFDLIQKFPGIMSELLEYIKELSSEKEIERFSTTYHAYKTILKQPVECYTLRSILNPREEDLYSKLKEVITTEFSNYEIGIKVRVADVLNVRPDLLGGDVFTYSLKAHFDYIVFNTSKNTLPVLAIELDGSHHRTDKKAIENDRKKNQICQTYGFPLIRISTLDYTNREHLLSILQNHLY